MKWEFKQVESYYLNYDIEQLGEAGWELVSVLRKDADSGPYVYFFKREKEQKKQLLS